MRVLLAYGICGRCVCMQEGKTYVVQDGDIIHFQVGLLVAHDCHPKSPPDAIMMTDPVLLLLLPRRIA